MSRHKVRSADADRFLQQMVEVINEGLLRDRVVKIKGFGTFKLQAVKERASVNVHTGEKVVIGEHDKVTFTPDSVMKEIINKPFSQFETVVIDDDSPLLKEGGLTEDFDDADEELEALEASEEVAAPVEIVVPEDVAAQEETSEDVAAPEDTETPVAPEKPAVPAEPETPERPAGLADFVAQAEPSEPETPADTAEPETPADTAEPETHVEPSEPSASVKPEIHETPDVRETPKEPVAVKETIEVKAEKIMVVADSVTVVAKDVKDEVGSQAASVIENEDSAEVSTEKFAGDTTEETKEDSTEKLYEESTEKSNEESTEKSTEESTEKTNEEMEEKKCKYCGALKYAAIAIVFFALGYLAGAEGLFSSLGRRTAMIVDSVKVKHSEILPDTTATDETDEAEEEAAEVASAENVSKAADNTSKAAENAAKASDNATTVAAKPVTKETAKPVTKETAKPVTKETAKPVTKETAKPVAKETAKPAADKPLTQYNNDFRVKTGAYYIIGTETEVTVQKGQTLRSISKAYLGPGMECYVEAYNGVKEVKAGQKIKIPKLKMKKLKK